MFARLGHPTTTQHNMKTETVSPNIAKAINSAAHHLADTYIANLRRDTENTLGTLESLAKIFHYELASYYHDTCESLGVRNARFRPEAVVATAKDEIRDALRREPSLATKLIAIRDAQKAVAMLA